MASRNTTTRATRAKAPARSRQAAASTTRAPMLAATPGQSRFDSGLKNLLRTFAGENQKGLLRGAIANSKTWSFPLRATQGAAGIATRAAPAPRASAAKPRATAKPRGAAGGQATRMAAKTNPATRKKLKAAGSNSSGRTAARGRNRTSQQQEAPMPPQAGASTEGVAH